MRPLPAAVLGACALLAACSSSSKTAERPCPSVTVVGEADRVVKYAGTGRDAADVTAVAEISSYQGSCKYNAKGVELAFQVSIDARLGPAASGRSIDLAYFVAVPAFYPSPQAKAVMPVRVTFPKDADQVRHTDEEVVMQIPLADQGALNQAQVFIGFQLSPEELERNRARR